MGSYRVGHSQNAGSQGAASPPRVSRVSGGLGHPPPPLQSGMGPAAAVTRAKCGLRTQYRRLRGALAPFVYWLTTPYGDV